VTFAVATTAQIGLGIKQQRDVEKAQEESAAVEQAVQGEQVARARRTNIRQAAVKRAQIENVAAASGQEGSSAVIAGTQQIAGDVSRNIGNIKTAEVFSSKRTAAQQNLFSAQQTSPLQLIAGAAQQGAIAFKS